MNLVSPLLDQIWEQIASRGAAVWSMAPNQMSTDSTSIIPANEFKGDNRPLWIDLQTLAYFNHFTTKTISTLPPDIRRSPEMDWRRDFVTYALQHEWLIYGLMAISASHMCSFEEDTGTRAIHRERFEQLHTKFSVMWNELTEMELETTIRNVIMETGWRVSCILQCFCWTLREPRPREVHATNPRSLDAMETVWQYFGTFSLNHYCLATTIVSIEVTVP